MSRTLTNNTQNMHKERRKEPSKERETESATGRDRDQGSQGLVETKIQAERIDNDVLHDLVIRGLIAEEIL